MWYWLDKSSCVAGGPEAIVVEMELDSLPGPFVARDHKFHEGHTPPDWCADRLPTFGLWPLSGVGRWSAVSRYFRARPVWLSPRPCSVLGIICVFHASSWAFRAASSTRNNPRSIASETIRIMISAWQSRQCQIVSDASTVQSIRKGER